MCKVLTDWLDLLYLFGIVVNTQQLMHAIAMVHKMQRLALSSSSMIPATPISEEPKELAVENDSSSTSNHKEQMDGIDPATPATVASTPDPVPASADALVQPSIVDGSSDPMDL